MRVLVISLSSAQDRRAFQAQQLSYYKLDYQFLDALSTEDIDSNTYQQHYQDWQRPMKPTEVACYYSHRSAWNKVLQTQRPALILEDDALLSSCVAELLSELEQENNADLVNLENRARKKFVSKTGRPISCRSKLFRLYQDRTGAAGYVLWPSGAKKLLECEKRQGIALADAHITACHSLKAFQVEPAPIIQLDHCEHYQITNPVGGNASASSVSSHINNKGGIQFWLKRIHQQVKLGFRQLWLITFTNRRYIHLRVQDFHQK